MSNTVKESVLIDLQIMKASTKNGVNLKGVRKVLQDELKKRTGIRGSWNVWFDGDDGSRYNFTITNPLYSISVWVQQNEAHNHND